MTMANIAASVKATAMPTAMDVNDVPSLGGTAAYITLVLIGWKYWKF